MCKQARPSEELGYAVLGAECYKWYKSRPSRLRIRVSVLAYDAWRVCSRLGTHDMAYGIENGRAGARQGRTFLDICHTTWHMASVMDVRACAKGECS